MNPLKHIVFSILTCLTLFHGYGQQPNATLSSNKIKIGEQTFLELTLKTKQKDAIAWFNFKDTLIKGIEILEQSKIDTLYDSLNQNLITLKQILTLTSFDSGYYAIPPQEVLVNGVPLYTEAALLSVATLAVDTTKGITDIKGPIETPLTLKDYFIIYKKYILWGALGIVLIALLVWLWFKFFRKKKVLEAPVAAPVIPAYEVALEALEELKNKQLWQKGYLKQYYSEITQIMFIYLEQELHIPALEKTSYELRALIKHKSISSEAQLRFNNLLTLADLVKFAKEQPIEQENELTMQYAIEFIELTHKKPEVVNINTSTPKK